MRENCNGKRVDAKNDESPIERPKRMSLSFILNQDNDECVEMSNGDAAENGLRENKGMKDESMSLRGEDEQTANGNTADGERESNEGDDEDDSRNPEFARGCDLNEESALLLAASQLRGGIHSRRFWTPDEDELLERLVAKHGKGHWRLMSGEFTDRTPAQLRSRWVHFVSDKQSKRPFTEEEDRFILTQYAVLGSKWNLIASKMTHRVGNIVKNRFRLLERHKNRIQKKMEQKLGESRTDSRQNRGVSAEGSTIGSNMS